MGFTIGRLNSVRWPFMVSDAPAVDVIADERALLTRLCIPICLTVARRSSGRLGMRWQEPWKMCWRGERGRCFSMPGRRWRWPHASPVLMAAELGHDQSWLGKEVAAFASIAKNYIL